MVWSWWMAISFSISLGRHLIGIKQALIAIDSETYSCVPAPV
jgi:hypothetical protein